MNNTKLFIILGNQLFNPQLYFKQITQDQVNSVDNDVLKEQRPEMPMNISRQSRVTFGGGNKN